MVASALALVACGGGSGEHAAGTTSGASSSGSGSSGSSGVGSSSGGGAGGAAATSSSSSSSGSGGASSSSSSSSSSSASSSGASVDVCGAASGQLAWTATIPSSSSSLGLVDIVASPTSNQVVVADTSGGSTVEQHRWSSAGAFVSLHKDSAGAYAGPLWASSIFMDPMDNLFYGVLLTGLAGGGDNGTKLTFTKLAPDATVAFTQPTTSALPVADGAPSVEVFLAGGDSGSNLHGVLNMGNPQFFQSGVYCYAPTGSNEGTSAVTVASTLATGDFMWPSQAGGLYVTKSVTANVALGGSCTGVTVPAAGGVLLAQLDGAGNCIWNKLLALPRAAVKASNFRLGADGSLYLAVVYSGTINLGSGALTSSGTNALAVARFGTAGNVVWAKSFGGAGSNFKIGSLSVNAGGTMVLTGGYAGTVDLGGGPLPATGDTFLAVFDTAGMGTLKWAKVVKVGAQGGLLAAAGKCGLVLATNSPTVDLGTGPLSTAAPPLAATIGVAALGL